ncbi:alpha/beta hydrolase [Gluconacetobacter entanii]|uniref:Arylesterase n=1 Tax=Gluconacetobacter entanii TaxID=108528 RepID=A0A318Q0C6_9PROT|nr:alpha/beta hydrolase [Gluconacetobacter entanii]PYD62313.1 arylesterase [Gluconacetobacter entanii]
MSTYSLVDPELLPLLTRFPAEDMSEATLIQARQQFVGIAAAQCAQSEHDTLVTKHEIHVTGCDGNTIRAVVYAPVGGRARKPLLLHCHGGGYMVGLPEMSELRNREYSHKYDIVVISVDYRLAPETPFPWGIEDCYAVLRHAVSHAGQFGIDPECVGVCGESAGGGLSASLALLVRDRQEMSLAFQMLFCPMLDDRTATTSDPSPMTGEFIWTRASNRFGWSCLLPHAPGGNATSPYAAAARARSLAGLAPAFMAIGALDLFVEETTSYAMRLIQAGVPVELHVYPGAMHAFEILGESRISCLANDIAGNALGRFTDRRGVAAG